MLKFPCHEISYSSNKLILNSLYVETWKLYGDAIWWALCTPFDVTFLNLLWADLQ